MNRRITVGAIAVSLGVWSGQLVAQQKDAPPQADKPREERTADVEIKIKTNGQQAKQSVVLRASDINGMTVRNQEGKELGSVKDVVIDFPSGAVKYAALSYGGFLGLGDKLFAVPWDALTHRHNVANNEHYLQLDVDEATLKAAPGFDDEKWPNFGDAKFSGGIDKYYEKYRYSTADAGDIAERRATAGPDLDQVEGQVAMYRAHRASKVMDMDVRNAAGEKLGDVDDLVIDVHAGQVRYAALSYGGVLGVGDKLFAVPWNAFKLHHDASEEEFYLVVHLNEATLKKASGFNKDAWPNFADPKISAEIDQYYNADAAGADSVKPGTTR